MKLLITRHDKIGDFVVTLPLIKAIKEQYPQTHITVLVSKVNFEFAQNIEFIDEVMLYDKEDFWSMLKKVRAQKFDASISAFIDTRLGWLLFLAGIKKRVAPATKIAQLFFNAKVVQRRSQVQKREWEYNLDLGKAIFPDIKLEFSKPLLTVHHLPFTKEKKVIFHAGFGGSSDGNLTLDDYINLARSIKNSEYEIVFSFGPDDETSKEYIQQHLDFEATIFDSKVSLMEFMQYIANSELFVSTSTGPMHLAGATNTQTLSFFGESLFASAKRWGTMSDEKKQNNFCVPANYGRDIYENIEKRLKEVL
ncbi:MAG: glycosyltransferase family 9 protein [Sulfurimonadaceae bacterium]